MGSSVNESNENWNIVNTLDSEDDKELSNLAVCLRKQLNFLKNEKDKLNEDVDKLGQEDSKLRNLISESEKNNSEMKIKITTLKDEVKDLRRNVMEKEIDRDNVEITLDRISEQKKETKRTLDILCDGKYDNLDQDILTDRIHQETEVDDNLLRKSFKTFLKGLGNEKNESRVETS